jgi:hypothetical protein
MAQFAVQEKTAGAIRLDWISLSLSMLLFASPWPLRYADLAGPSFAAWASAIVIALVSMSATIFFAEREEWVNLFAGLWLMAAPWVLGIAEIRGVVASFTGIGLCVVAISLAEIWAVRHPGWPETDVSEPS